MGKNVSLLFIYTQKVFDIEIRIPNTFNLIFQEIRIEYFSHFGPKHGLAIFLSHILKRDVS